MKILVTGALGQLGNELKWCFDNKTTRIGVPDVLKQDNIVEYIDLQDLDISDEVATRKYIVEGKFDAVINCAAFTNVDKCEEEIDLAYKANSLGPRNLAMACEEIGAKLVHISTDYVFSGDGTMPYREYDITSPNSIYGKTKDMGEKMVRTFCKKHFIIRTAWLYGYVGKNFVKTMLELAKKNPSLKVVNDQRGNPTNASDLAHHILKLLTVNEYGTYHGTCNGDCTWYDFTVEIMKQAGVDIPVNPCTTEEFPRPAKRPAYSCLDNMMFRTTVGDEFRPWQVALKEFLNNYLKGEN